MLIRYEVEFWDDDDKTTKVEKGLVSGETYSKAVDHLVNYFGTEGICEIKIYECEEVLCDEEIADMINK